LTVAGSRVCAVEIRRLGRGAGGGGASSVALSSRPTLPAVAALRCSLRN